MQMLRRLRRLLWHVHGIHLHDVLDELLRVELRLWIHQVPDVAYQRALPAEEVCLLQSLKVEAGIAELVQGEHRTLMAGLNRVVELRDVQSQSKLTSIALVYEQISLYNGNPEPFPRHIMGCARSIGGLNQGQLDIMSRR